MTDRPPGEVKDIQWALSVDGKAIQLTFIAQTGEKMVAQMADEAFTGFLSMLINVGVLSGEKTEPASAAARVIRADPIPISQMSIGPGRGPNEVVLTARTGMMELLLAVDPAILLTALRKLETMTLPPVAPPPLAPL